MLHRALSVLSCLAVLQVNTASTQCIPECPMDSIPGGSVQVLTLSPGEHRVLCFNYQYYKLADEKHVTLFDNDEEFCSTADDFFESGPSDVPGIECSVFDMNTTNSPCSHFAVAVRCEWSEDNKSILSFSGQDNEDKSILSSSGQDNEDSDIKSTALGTKEYLGLALQLESTNISLTGYERCNVILNVSWENVECNIKEIHLAPTDVCSGIGRVISAVGTNTSWFVVENLAINDIGEDVILIGGSTPFCEQQSINASLDGVGLLCEVVSGNSTFIRSAGINRTDLNSSVSYLAFRCSGDWNKVNVGEARIIFQRNLTNTLNSQCQSRSASRPFYSRYASFPVQWTHNDSILESSLCDQVNFNLCLQMCTDDVVSNGALCDTLVKNILDSGDLNLNGSMVVLSILWSLSNASDVQSLARAVRIIESLTKSYETSNLTLFQNGGIVPLLDKILNNQSVWKLLQQRNSMNGENSASSALLAGMEQLLSMAGRKVTDQPFQFVGTNILSLIERVTPQAIKDGYYTAYFPQTNSDEPKNFVLIPEQLLCAQTLGNIDCSSSVATALVQALPLYLDQISNIQTELFVNSRLLMLTVPDQANSAFPIKEYPVELHLNPMSVNGTIVMNHSCMFWDFNISHWSATGITTRVSPDGTYICTTTHLTSFAVLVGLTPPDNNVTATVEDKALSVMSYVGSGISLLCLILSLLILVTCGKRLNKGILLYIHINFCLSLCLALVVFIAGIESVVSIKLLCTVVAVALHYLFLCVFCWMLAEGIMLYILVVKVFGKLATRWYYFLLVGWGLPIPIVAVSVGIQHDLYGTDRFCWLSTESGTIWAFVGPMLLIVCVNSVFLVLTVCNLLHSRKYGGAERGVNTTQLVRSAIKTIAILLPLLGLTWVLGIFAVNKNTTVFAWMFTVCNSLQGFLFFVLHILRNEQVSKVLKRVVCCLTSSKARRLTTAKDISINVTDGTTSNAITMIGSPYREDNENVASQSYSQTSTESSSLSITDC